MDKDSPSKSWSQTCHTGLLEIDHEHDAIQAAFEALIIALRLVDGKPAAVEQFLNRILKLTREHIAHEESEMKRMGYPALEAHAADHQVVLERIQHVANEDVAAMEAKYLLPPVLLLERTMEDHMKTHDTDFAKFARAQREAKR